MIHMQKTKKKTTIRMVAAILVLLGGIAYLLADRYLIERVEIQNVSAAADTSAATVSAASDSTISTTLATAVPVTSASTADSTAAATGQVTSDDWTYQSSSVSISIQEVATGSGNNKVTYFVADVVIQDATQLASAGSDGVVRLWQAHSPTVGPLLLHQADAEPEVRLWDVSTANPAFASRRLGLRSETDHLLAVSPDGRYVALTSEGSGYYVQLWDTRRQGVDWQRLDQPGAIMTMKFSPDGRWLTVGDWNGNVRLWDMKTPPNPGFAFVDLPPSGGVRDLAFSADSRVLVTGDNWGQANVWRLDPPLADETPRLLRGHSGLVRTVAISSSGRWVLSGAWEPDNSAQLWDLAGDTSAPVVKLPFKGRLFATAFSPDERWAAAGSWMPPRNSCGWIIPPRRPSCSISTAAASCPWRSVPTATGWRPAAKTGA